jgi:hypothetical protein
MPRSTRTARVLTPLLATLGLLLAVPASASAFDFPKVKGWWPLNEGRGQTVYDWSGQRNHGMLGSTPRADANDPAWIKGIFWGYGLNFGGDDFIQIPDSAALEPQTFTLSLWVRAPQSPGPFSYLIAKGSSQCVAASYGIWTASNGGIEFYIWNGHDLVRSNSAVNGIWDGRWHNVSATYDGTNARLYIDGKSTGEAPGSSDPISYGQPDGATSFGGYRGSCDLLFSGDIDQVMLFDRVLPIEQIWDRWGFILNKPTLQ